MPDTYLSANEATERLGISERTLRYKLARWREAGEIDLATLAGERHGEDA